MQYYVYFRKGASVFAPMSFFILRKTLLALVQGLRLDFLGNIVMKLYNYNADPVVFRKV